MSSAPKPLRCAIYTRKSTEEGLEQDFNSLHAQREACEAYVISQKHEGWKAIPTAYDDGGYSGGTMDRPGLQVLLSDIASGRIDCVVVYKVDRLTRSLTDFARIVDIFDRNGVSFVSVTQSFNTTTSMGRLTLNVLLSFAQFEREVTAERIRDKIAASKKKGMRMGGPVPLGYEVKDKRLVVLEREAETVRLIFERYLELGCLTALARDLRERGIVTKVSRRRDGSIRGGIPFTKGPLAYLLRNKVYVGEVIHKGQHYPGEHDPIVSRGLFNAVQGELTAKAQGRGSVRVNRSSLLLGRIFDDRGNRMTPTTAKKGGARYRYYTSCVLAQGRREEAGSLPRVPAPEIESLVLEALAGEGVQITPGADSDVGRSEADRIASTVERVVVRQGTVEVLRKADDGEEPRVLILVPWSPAPRTRRREVIGIGDDHLVRPMRAETRARLVDGIARARAWLDELICGRVRDLAEIASREGCSERSVRMTINLAFISPEIVTAAVEGRLPHGTGTSRLCEAPMGWERQKELAGMGLRVGDNELALTRLRVHSPR
jgi:site-specific DNA recombinase